jgi:hypothetical protein
MVLGTAAIVLLAACGADNGIPDASISNLVDTVTLHSLSKGPLQSPTAYSLNSRSGVRTWDVGTNFEFAYSTDASDRSFFLPLDVLGLASSNSVKPGLKPSTIDFDQVKIAPRNGYTTSDSIPIVVGQTWFIRSAINSCSALSVPLYGKLKVLAIDTALNTATLQVLANQNCGYRALTLGIPKQ